MSDFLRFEKTEPDLEGMWLQVTASSPIITASSRIYVTGSVLEDLRQEIRDFLDQEDLEGYWENDVPGMGGPTCMTLRLIPRDRESHVLAEVYLELDDGRDYASHNCCFYVRTDRSSLARFAEDLALLQQPRTGITVTLNRS